MNNDNNLRPSFGEAMGQQSRFIGDSPGVLVQNFGLSAIGGAIQDSIQPHDIEMEQKLQSMVDRLFPT